MYCFSTLILLFIFLDSLRAGLTVWKKKALTADRALRREAALETRASARFGAFQDASVRVQVGEFHGNGSRVYVALFLVDPADDDNVFKLYKPAYAPPSFTTSDELPEIGVCCTQNVNSQLMAGGMPPCEIGEPQFRSMFREKSIKRTKPPTTRTTRTRTLSDRTTKPPRDSTRTATPREPKSTPPATTLASTTAPPPPLQTTSSIVDSDDDDDDGEDMNGSTKKKTTTTPEPTSDVMSPSHTTPDRTTNERTMDDKTMKTNTNAPPSSHMTMPMTMPPPRTDGMLPPTSGMPSVKPPPNGEPSVKPPNNNNNNNNNNNGNTNTNTNNDDNNNDNAAKMSPPRRKRQVDATDDDDIDYFQFDVSSNNNNGNGNNNNDNIIFDNSNDNSDDDGWTSTDADRDEEDEDNDVDDDDDEDHDDVEEEYAVDTRNPARFWIVKSSAKSWSSGDVVIDRSSGLYRVVIVSCDSAAVLELSDVEIRFQNPYGYLGASQFTSMPLHIFLALTYFVLCVAWSSLLLYRRNNVVRMHMLLLVVYLFAFLSELLSALSWTIYNYATGYVSLGWNIATAIAVPFRHIACWLFLLLVCLGYDIYVYSLDWRRRVALSVAVVVSFVVTGLHQSMSLFTLTPQLEKSDFFREVAPNVIEGAKTLSDLLICTWICLELLLTLRNLKRQKQTIKLQRYRLTAFVIGACLAIYTIVFLTQFVLQLSIDYAALWHGDVYYSTVWPLLLLLILIVAFVVVRPTLSGEYQMSELVEDQRTKRPSSMQDGVAATSRFSDEYEDARRSSSGGDIESNRSSTDVDAIELAKVTETATVNN